MCSVRPALSGDCRLEVFAGAIYLGRAAVVVVLVMWHCWWHAALDFCPFVHCRLQEVHESLPVDMHAQMGEFSEQTIKWLDGGTYTGGAD